MGSTPSSWSPHILVVDDEPDVRDALAYGLADVYTVHTAATGPEACAVLRTEPIAAIVLDAFLGKDNGLDCIAAFRTLSSARIMILTGYGSEDLAMRAIWANADGYMKKPVSMHDLQAAVDRLIPPLQSPPDIAARARRRLDDHPPKLFRWADFAHQLGVGESQLRRVFREAYGKTPRRYLMEVRIRRAADLLLATDQGIKEIAEEAGFSSHTRFGKVFRLVYGVTPSEYRAARESTSG